MEWYSVKPISDSTQNAVASSQQSSPHFAGMPNDTQRLGEIAIESVTRLACNRGLACRDKQ